MPHELSSEVTWGHSTVGRTSVMHPAAHLQLCILESVGTLHMCICPLTTGLGATWVCSLLAGPFW